jgi:hypothetical protein
MKLVSIIITWADTIDLLPYCIHNHLKFSDHVMIIYSDTSNYGEKSNAFDGYFQSKFNASLTYDYTKISYYKWEPNLSISASDNERAKRNYGLDKARDSGWGFTHFLMADSDEFYLPSEVLNSKVHLEATEHIGFISETQVYFKSPSLTIGKDSTLVPFIHKIYPQLRFTWNKSYPYAWEDKKIKIDPTRQLNISFGVSMYPITMHHYSWVRSDFQMKIRNSSAKSNLERSTIMQDIMHAKEDYFCEFYQKTLVRASVDFGIPEITPRNE